MQQQFTPYQVQEMRKFFDPTKRPSETFNDLSKRLNLSDLDIQDWFYDNQDYIKKQEELQKKSQVTPTQDKVKSQNQAQSTKQATQQDYKAQLQDQVAQGVIRAQLKKTLAEIEPMPLEEVRARLDVLLGAEEMRQFETHIRTVAYHRMWTKAQIDAEIDKSFRHRLEHYKEYQKYLPERVEAGKQDSGRPDQAQTQEGSNSAQNLAEVEDEHLKEVIAFAKKLSCDQLFNLVTFMTENKDQVLRQVMEKAAEKVMKKLEVKKQAKAQEKQAEKAEVKDLDQAQSEVQAKTGCRAKFINKAQPQVQAQLQEQQQFTAYQVKEMRKFFDPTKKTSETFDELGKRLNLSDLDIQDWFYDNQDYLKKQEELQNQAKSETQAQSGCRAKFINKAQSQNKAQSEDKAQPPVHAQPKDKAQTGCRAKFINKAHPQVQAQPSVQAQTQAQAQPDVQAKSQVQAQPFLSEEQQSMAKVLLHVYAVSQNKTFSNEPTNECKEQARSRLQALSPYLAPRQLEKLTRIVNSSDASASEHPHFETLLLQHEMLNQAQKLMEAEQKIQKLEEEKRDLEHELEAQADQIDEAYSALEAQNKDLVQANQDLKAQNKAHEKEKAELKMEIQEVKEAWRVSQTLMKTMMQEAVDLRKSQQSMKDLQDQLAEMKLSAVNNEEIYIKVCEDFAKTKEINLNLKSQIDKMSKDNQLAVQDSAKKDKKLAEMEVYVSKLKGMIHYMDQDLSEFENKEIIQKWKLAEKEKELVEMEKKVAKLEEELRKKNDEIEFLNEDW